MGTARIIGGPAAWRGSQIADHTDWKIGFTTAQRAELLAALRVAMGTGKPLRETTAADFPLPTLAGVLAGVVDELLDGRGFFLLRDVPIDGLDDTEIELLYWGIGRHVGQPIHQKGPDDLLVRVRDQGLDPDDPHVRGFQTASRLDYHADSSDVVGLLCIRPAKWGGVSTIVSSVAVHDEMVRRHPELADLLHAPWWHDRRSGDGPENFFQCRIYAEHHGKLFAHYGRSYMESASRSPDVPELTPLQVRALDALDELTNSPELVLNMNFRPGDIQLLNNYTIMHARTEYVDHPELERRRELIRLWLTMTRDLDLPEDFARAGIVQRDAAFT